MTRLAAEVRAFREDAIHHRAWCAKNDVPLLGGRWDAEDPLTGLLLSALVHPDSGPTVLASLVGGTAADIAIIDVWWPRTLIDLVVNFRVGEIPRMMLLEHKQVHSPSNAPGYKQEGGGTLWQTEMALRAIEQHRESGENLFLGGPFDPDADAALVVLDARGRSMAEIFDFTTMDASAHRHDRWAAVSYRDLTSCLRSAYEESANRSLLPLLGQIYAGDI